MTAYKLLYSRAIAFKFHGMEAIKKNSLEKAPDVCGVGGRVGGGGHNDKKIEKNTVSFIVTSGSSTRVLHSRFCLSQNSISGIIISVSGLMCRFYFEDRQIRFSSWLNHFHVTK